MKDKFSDAWRGLRDSLCHPSVTLQFCLALCALTAGFIMRLSLAEWLVVVLCIGAVIAAEIFNTCIEKICDMYSSEKDERIRLIKDMSAGAVFVVSITAFIAAMMILFSHLTGGVI